MKIREPQVTDSVILVDDEVLLARTAVRKYLQKLRGNYRNDLRRGRDLFAATHLSKFDDYLSLYAQLGGNPEDVADPEDQL